MKRKNIYVYKTETGALAFFPSAPLIKLGWILNPENVMENANRSRDFGQFIGLPLVFMLFLFITKYLNLVQGIVPASCLFVFLFALLFLAMYLISHGTARYKKSIHGSLTVH